MSDVTDWKETILLPETAFPMRANLAAREAETASRWKEQRLYHRMLEARADAPAFTLHDGPPYANGGIHHGHALNKILKDVVVKYRHLAGFRATNIPGWDCHGLPIEQKVDEEVGAAKAGMSVVEFRARCRAYAQRHVDLQRSQFERLLLLAEWERPYLTMSYDYEATTLREIGRFIDGGYVYSGLKPVHWSWAAATALADAEVEYAAYTAPSVYVRFALESPPAWLADAAGGRAVDAVIWTTTPWTLPSNVAIVLHPDMEYQLLALDAGAAIIVATELSESVRAACALGDLEVLSTFAGAQLVGTGEADAPRLVARHPFIDRTSVLLPATYVTAEQGTGLVHTAPGHGAEDFETGLKFGLPVLAPVGAEGRYTAELAAMGPFASGLVGKHVFAANPIISEQLATSGRLLNRPGETVNIARYPHCWRTKKPLIFRATAQWFINVDHDRLRERCLEAIGETRWIPHWGENRIRAMIEARPDWCISRQRVWGVPIPAFVCGGCGGHVLSGDVARHVAELCETRGADVWFEEGPEALTPPGLVCPSCGAGPSQFEKVTDILDVWFDSGVSWAAVLRDREGLGEIADLYLEGSDQHRGWFHTSLLVAEGTAGHAPYRSVLTHGFIVDANGHKYSKSSPNFEPLDKMLAEHGAEVLRAWVAMVDYRHDMALAPELLKQTSGAYRKIRNTVRFLLGSVGDFDPARYPLEQQALDPLDRWALSKAADFVERAAAGYDACELHAVFHTLFEYCNESLSAVTLDVLKDRLYCESADDPRRRASQAVLYASLRAVVIAMAPILSFTADEAWGFMRLLPTDADNVFLSRFPTPDGWRDAEIEAQVAAALAIRARVQEQIEARRPKTKGEQVEGQIGSSQEAHVSLMVTPAAHAALGPVVEHLRELFIVAAVDVTVGEAADASGVDVAVAPSHDPRCQRCWNHRPDVGGEHADLCGRCATVIEANA
ncbi:MAG: isoleucine--tRNA ligase [Myxococcales bacterium]|nr:isoleucine--tRNA ligase [Myxococcales bacterium]MCB9519602.1 isoleucine--tRNA ligase [Myxococcales bacterium]MCB9530671.1 isoleucine--tRNA ligase [Myxococcales bacterium]MCB9533592.1 isoleucine--tRNA ligase [Myxococcales bacterium]